LQLSLISKAVSAFFDVYNHKVKKSVDDFFVSPVALRHRNKKSVDNCGVKLLQLS
jgi:hypothetical protein